MTFDLSPGSGARHVDARRDFRALPRRQRADAFRLAREGKHHPDPRVAATAYAWAASTSGQSWQPLSAVINVGVAVWAVSRIGSSRVPVLVGLLFVAGLGSAWLLTMQWLMSRRIARLGPPDPTAVLVAAPVRSPAVAGGRSGERVDILSDHDKAQLALVAPPDPEPGWYSDPMTEDVQRWWNGTQWTGRTLRS